MENEHLRDRPAGIRALNSASEKPPPLHREPLTLRHPHRDLVPPRWRLPTVTLRPAHRVPSHS